jgi:hypothetical protein
MSNNCPASVNNFIKLPDTPDLAKEAYSKMSGATATPKSARVFMQKTYPSYPLCAAPCVKKCADKYSGSDYKASPDAVGQQCVLACAKACGIQNPNSVRCFENVTYDQYDRQLMITERDAKGQIVKGSDGVPVKTRNPDFGKKLDENVGSVLVVGGNVSNGVVSSDGQVLLHFSGSEDVISQSNIDDRLFTQGFDPKFKTGRVAGVNIPQGSFRNMWKKSTESWVPTVDISAALNAIPAGPALDTYSAKTMAEAPRKTQ